MKKYIALESCHFLYPMELFYGVFSSNGERERFHIPNLIINKGEWGDLPCMLCSVCCEFVPDRLEFVWLSILEREIYSINNNFSDESKKKFLDRGNLKGEIVYIIIGIAPYGGVAIWIYEEAKAILVMWLHAEITHVNWEDYILFSSDMTLKQVCLNYINSDPRVRDNLSKNGLPPRDLFDNYMKQFTYRYLVIFGHWDEEKKEWRKEEKNSQQTISSYGKLSQTEKEEKSVPEFEYIEEALYDGTHDKLHDGGLMNYHQAGKPKKLAVKWHIKKSEYMAYFWFEDEAIREVFDRFYGAHPDTKTDFMIRIDSDNKKFELALYRYGLNEPQAISESAYQLIVFKNKFEYFRSENYDQPRGAWIW